MVQLSVRRFVSHFDPDMKTKHKIGLGIVFAAVVIAVTGWYLTRHTVAVLEPAGRIGRDERNLMALCIAISGGIVIPVFGLLAYFGWKYREGNKRAGTYSPDLDGNHIAETIWWVIPTILLIVIGTITWRSSYALDPFKRLASSKPTMHVQVVALDWKWLFIYPDQHVASVNEVTVPVGTPVDFEITSDAVMTSFWAPQLGGQMYAMPGMATHLNLVADKAGSYNGSAANISGKDFADMTFTVHAVSQAEYGRWMNQLEFSPNHLTESAYQKLALPGVQTTALRYSSVDQGLYDTILMKYMMPIGTNEGVIE